MENRNPSKHPPDMSEQQLWQILSSPQGQSLLRLLSRDGGTALQSAIQAAKNGNYALAQQLLAPMVQSEQAQQLLAQLRAAHG